MGIRGLSPGGATGWLPPRSAHLSPTHGGVSVSENLGAEFESLQGEPGPDPRRVASPPAPPTNARAGLLLTGELAEGWSPGTCSAVGPRRCLAGVGGYRADRGWISWDLGAGSRQGEPQGWPTAFGAHSLRKENVG